MTQDVHLTTNRKGKADFRGYGNYKVSEKDQMAANKTLLFTCLERTPMTGSLSCELNGPVKRATLLMYS